MGIADKQTLDYLCTIATISGLELNFVKEQNIRRVCSLSNLDYNTATKVVANTHRNIELWNYYHGCLSK